MQMGSKPPNIVPTSHITGNYGKASHNNKEPIDIKARGHDAVVQIAIRRSLADLREIRAPDFQSPVQLPTGPSRPLRTVDDPDDRMSLDIFLAIEDRSEEVYNMTRDAILGARPTCKMLIYSDVKQLATEIMKDALIQQQNK